MVTQHDVTRLVAGHLVPRVHRVRTSPAQHHVRTIAGRNLVIPAHRRIRRLDARQHAIHAEQGQPVVAQNHVGAFIGPGPNHIRPAPAQHHVVAIPRVDPVRPAHLGRARPNLPQHARPAHRVKPRRPLVAQHHVVTRPAVEHVVPNPAQHHIRTTARPDDIVPALRRIRRLDQQQHAARVEHRIAMVTQHDVIARPGIDDVIAGSAQDGVVAFVPVDLILATQGRIRRGDLDDHATGQGDRAEVSEDDIPAGAARHPIRAQAGDDEVVAVIAGNPIITSAAGDAVVTFVAGDDQARGDGRRVDDIVALLAVQDQGERSDFRDQDEVVTAAGPQGGGGAGAGVSRGDDDAVAAGAAFEVDPAAERAAGGGVKDGGGSEPVDRGVGNDGEEVRRERGLVTDVEGVDAGAGVHIEQAQDGIERAVVGRGIGGHIDDVLAAAGADDGRAGGGPHVHRVIALVGPHRGGAPVRANDGEGVGAGAQRDVQGLDGVVAQAVCHPEPRQPGVREFTRVRRRVARIVNVERVLIRIAMHGQRGANAVHGAQRQRGEAPHIDRVPALAGVDGGRPGHRPEVEDVVAGIRLDHRFPGMRRVDVEGVASGAEGHADRFERAVGNARRHAKTRQLRGGQGAGGRVRAARVIHVQPIRAFFAIHTEQTHQAAENAARRRGQAAHVDGIVALPAQERRRTGRRADLEVVVTAAGVEGGGARVGRVDREGVAARTQEDMNEFEFVVGDPFRHAQAREPGGRQLARVTGRREAEVHMERIRIRPDPAVDREQRLEALEHRGFLAPGLFGEHDIHPIGAQTRVNGGRAAETAHGDDVAAVPRVHRRHRAGIGVDDLDRIRAVAGREVNRRETTVADRATHPQASQPLPIQLAHQVLRARRTVHNQRILAAPAEDEEVSHHPREHPRVRGGIRGHIQHVVVRAQVHRGLRPQGAQIHPVRPLVGRNLEPPRCVLDQDLVRVRPGAHHRVPHVGRHDRHLILPAEERDLQGGHVRILHCAGAHHVDDRRLQHHLVRPVGAFHDQNVRLALPTVGLELAGGERVAHRDRVVARLAQQSEAAWHGGAAGR